MSEAQSLAKLAAELLNRRMYPQEEAIKEAVDTAHKILKAAKKKVRKRR